MSVEAQSSTDDFPYLISVASQRLDRDTSGESKKDHGCTEEDYDGANGVTLCGRRMGKRWFPRRERFTGAWSFHCERCVRAAVKRGLLDPTKLDERFKAKGIGGS
jgi:hypothetical protein